MSEVNIICQNKKARHDYFIEESMEAGIVLRGPEVKSLRAGKANLSDSYASVERGEVWIINCHISPYDPAYHLNSNPLRKRKLLLHKKEINRLTGKFQEQGWNIIPLKLYFKDGKVKVEISLAKSKKQHDKRETIKARQAKREIDQAMKNNR